jgi:hypothetical protein
MRREGSPVRFLATAAAGAGLHGRPCALIGGAGPHGLLCALIGGAGIAFATAGCGGATLGRGSAKASSDAALALALGYDKPEIEDRIELEETYPEEALKMVKATEGQRAYRKMTEGLIWDWQFLDELAEKGRRALAARRSTVSRGTVPTEGEAEKGRPSEARSKRRSKGRRREGPEPEPEPVAKRAEPEPEIEELEEKHEPPVAEPRRKGRRRGGPKRQPEPKVEPEAEAPAEVEERPAEAEEEPKKVDEEPKEKRKRGRRRRGSRKKE